MTDALSIAQGLLRCPSVTPNEGGALRTLKEIFDAAGFATHIVTFSEPGAADVDNLYARFGAGAPHIAFAGHTDVVPPGDKAQWRFDPFSGEIADGMIWGRGAADMKGGIAAAVAAALRVIGRGAPKGSIGFLITGDEEGPAVNGTVKLLEWAHARGERFDHCIVGEPTSRQVLGDTIKNGRRGSLSGAISLIGRQGHVAYPHLAQNPARGLAPLLEALYAPALDDGTADFDASNFEVTSIDVGNAATNVIPAEIRIVFNIRFNDTWTPASLSAEIRRRVAKGAGDLRAGVTFQPCNAEAFLTPGGAFTEMASDAVAAIVGRRPELSTNGGTSDARFIRAYCPVVELGLVGQTMHAVDERVAIADLEDLSRIYERLFDLYFAAPPSS
jgi:succinyl-diaminopimelate desuccinylase